MTQKGQASFSLQTFSCGGAGSSSGFLQAPSPKISMSPVAKEEIVPVRTLVDLTTKIRCLRRVAAAGVGNAFRDGAMSSDGLLTELQSSRTARRSVEAVIRDSRRCVMIRMQAA